MGWGSGTKLFDEAVGIILIDVPFERRKAAIEKILIAFEDHDWDCQCDSIFYENPIVKRVMKKVHPDWFVDGD